MEMENDFNSADKVEKILKSIDGLKKIAPQPFFYTRLMARLNKKENIWERWSAFIVKPATVFACICMVVIMNIAAVFYNKQASVLEASQNEISLQDEYSQVATNFYDFENVKP